MTSILLFHSFKELPSVPNLSADPRFGSAKVHFLFTLPNFYFQNWNKFFLTSFSASPNPSSLHPGEKLTKNLIPSFSTSLLQIGLQMYNFQPLKPKKIKKNFKELLRLVTHFPLAERKGKGMYITSKTFFKKSFSSLKNRGCPLSWGSLPHYCL